MQVHLSLVEVIVFSLTTVRIFLRHDTRVNKDSTIIDKIDTFPRRVYFLPDGHLVSTYPLRSKRRPCGPKQIVPEITLKRQSSGVSKGWVRRYRDEKKTFAKSGEEKTQNDSVTSE